MTTHELLELALLDCYGLLDEAEREAFEDAFRGAPPAVQAQIRREQTRLAGQGLVLPDAEPPAGLRARVVEAVLRAIASGRAQRHAAGRFIPPLLPSRGVSAVWRAAALGMAAAVVIFGASLISLKNSNDLLARGLEADTLIADMTRTLGPTAVNDILFDRDTKRVVFQPADTGFKGEAAVFTSPDWKERAKFFCRSLPAKEGRAYRLAIVDDNDQVVRTLVDFGSTGGLISREIELAADRPAGRMAILAATDDRRDDWKVISRSDSGSL